MTIHLRVCIAALGYLLVAAPSFAQPGSFIDGLRDHLSIRQSLKDKNTINEPAFVTLTMPDEGPSVNVVALAATAFLKADADNPKFNVGAALQFNQNSAADQRQNVFIGGVDLEARSGGDNASQPFYFARLKGTAGYKRNGEKHTDGMTANAYLTYEKNRPGSDSSSIPLGNGQVEFTPQAALEFENALSATDIADEGKVTRGLLAVTLNAFPLPLRFRERLILSADLAYRRDVQTDFVGSDRDHLFAQFSVALTLDPYKIFSLSLDRVVGEDPTQGFAGPAFTRLAFKVQLTRPQKRSIFRATRAAQHII